MSGSTAAPDQLDERLVRTSPLRKLLGRPELGSVVGAAAVFLFFAIVADSFLQASSFGTVLYAASVLGIMAAPVALLMIGGEFDLSAGVMVTSSALISSMFSYQMTANVWVGVFVSLLVTLAIGAFNGFMLTRTKLPSFIITLGTFLMLTGLNLGFTKLISGTVSTKAIGDMEGFESARVLFASTLTLGGVEFKVTILWWAALVGIATWILLRTRFGNWIFAVGGEADAARAVGVPVIRTKIGLYLGVAFAAWISGQHLLFSYDVVQSGEGVGNELTYIIAAVIGGCLITGGYGSAIGSAVGAFIFGMTSKGIVYAEWNPDWFKFFLGAMLLLATLLNAWVRKRAGGDNSSGNGRVRRQSAGRRWLEPDAHYLLDRVKRQHPRHHRAASSPNWPARAMRCASSVLQDIGQWLGVGIANLAAALDPSCFVIGGGVSAADDLLIGPARDAFKRSPHRPRLPPRGPGIAKAQLGPEAGMVGAADLARLVARRFRRANRRRVERYERYAQIYDQAASTIRNTRSTRTVD
ncbi:hypothetical protein SMICM304S_08304 [Streptomyces microflavus]